MAYTLVVYNPITERHKRVTTVVYPTRVEAKLARLQYPDPTIIEVRDDESTTARCPFSTY